MTQLYENFNMFCEQLVTTSWTVCESGGKACGLVNTIIVWTGVTV